MRCVLALDLATTAGWALFKDGLSKPRASTVKMPDIDPEEGKAVPDIAMGKWMEAFLEHFVPFASLEGVTDIVTEAPFISNHGGSGVNMYEVEKNITLTSAAGLLAVRLGARFKKIARSTVCAHFIGNGRGTRKQFKTGCLLGCQRKGWNVTSEDMADALATLDWYCHFNRIDVPWDCKPGLPLFQGSPGTTITKANKIASATLLNKALSFDRATGAQ
jgi:hypothetical protein